jgi:23S rRNA-/tRNA-specific pseudouridylate synthase
MPVDLLEVTSHEIVVLKPAGLASELPHDPAADSLLRRLAAQGYTDLRLVHRLDAPACGLMLVARSAEAAAHYAREIAARRWHKWYVAQVAVSPEKAEQLVGAHKSYLKVDGRSARVVRARSQPRTSSFWPLRYPAPPMRAICSCSSTPGASIRFG